MKSKLAKNASSHDYYVAGITAMLEKDLDEALELLTKCVKIDSDVVEAYYYIGKIFREKGELARAIRVHSDLLLRPGLKDDFSKKLTLDLVEDGMQAGDIALVEELLTKKLKKDSHPYLNEYLVKVYSAKAEWKKAIDIQKSLAKSGDAVQKRILAGLCTCYGDELRKTDEHEARIQYRNAIKQSPDYPWPYVYMADSYFAVGRTEDALKFWERLFDELSEKSYLIFDKLEKYFFESGQYGEVGKIYRLIVEKAKGGEEAFLSLINYLSKIGKIDEALFLIEDENCPWKEVAAVKFQKVNLLLEKKNVDKKTVKLINSLFKELVPSRKYVCSSCNSEFKKAFPRCTNCGSWDDYKIK